MPLYIQYRLVCAQELTDEEPDYTLADPPGSVAGATVSRADLQAFSDALDGKIICARQYEDPPDDLWAEIRNAVLTLLLAAHCPIQDAYVNNSRPTAEPNVWKRGGLVPFVHPVRTRVSSKPYIAYAQDPTGIWRQATVLVQRVGTPCPPPTALPERTAQAPGKPDASRARP